MFESSNQRRFQKGLDSDKMRSNRRDSQLTLRRKTREAHLQKRMRTLSATRTQGNSQEPQPSRDLIPKYVANVMQTESLEMQLSGVHSLRLLLSQQNNPPSAQVAKCGVVPKILQFISIPDDESEHRGSSPSDGQTLRQKLQFEAAWIVCNLASGKGGITQIVVRYGAINKLVEMFRRTKDEKTQDMAVWALGNISGESRAMTEQIVATGFLDDLVTALPSMKEDDIRGNTAWTISNIMRCGPTNLTDANFAKIIPAMARLLRESTKPDVLKSTLWTLVYITNTHDQLLPLMERHGAVSEAMRLLALETAKYDRTMALETAKLRKAKGPNADSKVNEHNVAVLAAKAMDHLLCRPCLRFLGNVISGPDELVQVVLDGGYLDVILPFVNHPIAAQRKEMVWSISNILAGSAEQIEAVISRDDLLRSIIRAATSDNQAVKQEATWCLGNATVDAASSQIKKLADFGAIEALCKMLNPAYSITDQHVMIIVEALDAILKVYGTGGYNPYMDAVEECRGLDFLEDRQSDNRLTQETYEGILNLLKKYWSGDDEFGDHNKEELALKDQIEAEVDASTNTFKFGCNQSAAKMPSLGNNGFGHKNNGGAVYQF